MQRERTLSAIFKYNKKLNKFVSKSHQLKEQQLLLRAELSLLFSASTDPNHAFIKNIYVCSYRNGFLKLLVENSAIHTKLRFVLPQLTQKLKGHQLFNDLQHISLKMSAFADEASNIKVKKPNKISAQNLALLKATLKALKN